MTALRSAIARGRLRHRRFTPVDHKFVYASQMIWLDLDELAKIDQLPLWSCHRRNLIEFRRGDYLDPDVPDLKQAVNAALTRNNISARPGRVVALTNLRSWGQCFNPVSFYFCFDTEERLYAIVAQINNTPWDERHTYVLTLEPQQLRGQLLRFKFEKCFHVSPFMPMDLQYDWRFRLDSDRVCVYMGLSDDDQKQFDASLDLQLQALTTRTARWVPIRYPAVCARILGAIYWQALRLWLKRVPFIPHPARQKATQHANHDFKNSTEHAAKSATPQLIPPSE